MPDAAALASEEFCLPSLGADMETGTVLEWMVSPGDFVASGDVVTRIETEKSDIDVEIWQSGVIADLLIEVGEQIPVGTPILRFEGSKPAPAANGSDHPAEDIARPRTDTAESPKLVISEPANTAKRTATLARTSGERIPASPHARQFATERQIDLETITGTGPSGAILIRDLDSQATPDPPVPSTAKPEPPARDRMRDAIAQRMAKANAEIPHYHLQSDVDLGPALDWLEHHNAELAVGERVLPAALFAKAVARAAGDRPSLNGFWTENGFETADAVNIAIAVSLRKGGLVTPVIARADELPVDEVMAHLRDLVAGARSGSLRSSWMSGASITITNLGDNGADLVHGVIFPPQVALVGFGRVTTRPWIVDGEIVPRPIVTVSLSADHRATDGATGSRFLAAIDTYLTHPEEL